MLSLFPQFFDWSWYVPFFFRMFLAVYALGFGVALIKHQETETTRSNVAWVALGTLVSILGLSFFFGVYTQLSGIIGASLATLAIVLKNKHPMTAIESKKFYFLIILVSLSLLFLGAGPYAFDIPL